MNKVVYNGCLAWCNVVLIQRITQACNTTPDIRCRHRQYECNGGISIEKGAKSFVGRKERNKEGCFPTFSLMLFTAHRVPDVMFFLPTRPAPDMQ